MTPCPNALYVSKLCELDHLTSVLFILGSNVQGFPVVEQFCFY